MSAILFTLAALPGISNAQTCSPMPSGMVGWWPANGNADDIIGAKNATLFNGAGYVPGRVGQAFNFDGGDDHAVVPASTEWAFGTGNFTVEFWMKSATNDARRPIVNNRATPASDSIWAIEIYDVANRVEFHSGLPVFLTATNTLIPSSWNHVAVTRSGATLTIYINGLWSGSVSNGTNFSSVNDLQIGRDIMSGNDLDGNSFQGQIDELSISRHAVTPAEISAIYNAGIIGKCSSCAPAPVGLTSWWPGDGSPNDIQGTNHGTMVNGAGYSQGLVGQAFSFDGINDHVNVGNAASLKMTGAVTLDAWIKTSFPGGYHNVISDHGPSADNGKILRFFNNQIQFLMGVSGTTTAAYTFDSGAAGVWQHVAATYDGHNLKLYVNGVLRDTQARGGTVPVNNNPILIGASGFGEYFSGLIDEVEIFSRALSQEEIQAVFKAGSFGKCKSCEPVPVGLAAWWTGGGNGLDSRSVNNGTLQNGATYSSGKVGQAFSLDGMDDYVSIANTPTLDVGMGDFTIDLWINLDSLSSDQTLFHKVSGTGSSPNDPSYFLEYNVPNTLRFRVGESLASNNDLFVPANLVAGTWYHITADREGNTNRIYRNGELLGSQMIGSVVDAGSGGSAAIGRCLTNPCVRFVDGLIDEVDLFTRALSVEEIRAIYNAGSFGKCKPTATTAPSGLVAWWGGDGDARDLSGNGINGAPQNGVGYAVGKVGQAFDLAGSGDYVHVATTVGLPVGVASRTMMLWFKTPNAWGSQYAMLMQYGGTAPASKFGLMVPDYDGRRLTFWGENSDLSGGTILQPNTWYHGAVTYDGNTVRLYLNGQPEASHAFSLNTFSGSDFTLGRYGSNSNITSGEWDGLIDEADIYNRALSLAEIQSIINAGLAGKLKSQITPANTFAEPRNAKPQWSFGAAGIQLGDATVTLPIISTGGVTQQIPLDPAKLPPLPMGATPTNLVYDIATSAIWSGTPSVCFNLPALAPVYRNLRIMHLENGVWVNRTQIGGMSPALCSAGLTSLSPFAIVDFGPTAATVSISGRVLTNDGRGIRNAIVTMTNPDGTTLIARSSTFGYYRFEEVVVAQSYVMDVRSKAFNFAPRLVQVTDNVSDFDLVALE